MQIQLNNRIEEFDGISKTISEILKIKNFTFPRIIVKLNGKLIKKPSYDNTQVRDGDELNVIHLISGG
jgi:thiamine biosynthesis protein ThiS